ncbi:MAG: hypothetical protein PVI23_07235 [Maricaulaceae bacterium]
MSFREKSAWITFLTVLLAAAVNIAVLSTGRLEGLERLHFLFLCVVGLVVLQVVLHVVVAIMNPADARSPKDERERAIQLRSHSVGYYVLLVGVLGMFITGHTFIHAGAVLYHALAAMVLSTLSISLTQIILFRIGR